MHGYARCGSRDPDAFSSSVRVGHSGGTAPATAPRAERVSELCAHGGHPGRVEDGNAKWCFVIPLELRLRHPDLTSLIWHAGTLMRTLHQHARGGGPAQCAWLQERRADTIFDVSSPLSRGVVLSSQASAATQGAHPTPCMGPWGAGAGGAWLRIASSAWVNSMSSTLCVAMQWSCSFRCC